MNKNKKWLWIAIATLTKPDDQNVYEYRTGTLYGTFQQVNLDLVPAVESSLQACGWSVREWKLEKEDDHVKVLEYIHGVTNKIVKV